LGYSSAKSSKYTESERMSWRILFCLWLIILDKKNFSDNKKKKYLSNNKYRVSFLNLYLFTLSLTLLLILFLFPITILLFFWLFAVMLGFGQLYSCLNSANISLKLKLSTYFNNRFLLSKRKDLSFKDKNIKVLNFSKAYHWRFF